MDDILELFLTILAEALSNMKCKDSRKRTWVMTGVFSLLSLLLEVFMIWNAVDLLRQGSMTGTIVLAVIAIAVLAVSLIFIIWGHGRDWDHY